MQISRSMFTLQRAPCDQIFFVSFKMWGTWMAKSHWVQSICYPIARHQYTLKFSCNFYSSVGMYMYTRTPKGQRCFVVKSATLQCPKLLFLAICYKSKNKNCLGNVTFPDITKGEGDFYLQIMYDISPSCNT